MFQLVRSCGKWIQNRLLLWLAARLGVASLLFARGTVSIEHYRAGNLLQRFQVPNGIVDVGMNKLLDVFFHNQTQIATWYIGLVNNSGFSSFSNADTMAAHAGWTEWTSYDEANRVTWAEDAAASRAISNTTSADFTISATGTLHGIFVTDENTKGGATGTLWSTAAFSSNINVVDDDVIKITYTVSG